MEYSEYLSGITFRLIHPETWLPYRVAKLINQSSRLGFPLERWITKLPQNEKATKRLLRPLCRIPKFSSFAMGAIIHEGVSRMSPEHAFVNVGTWHGFTFLCGMIGNPNKRCIGIDNFSHKKDRGEREGFASRFEQYRTSQHLFYEMDYQRYFAEIHEGSIGFYIYDGIHRYANQLEALQMAEPNFADDCIVFIDDTNGEEPRKATLDFIEQSQNHYQILLDRTTSCRQHPTFWEGVIVFKRIASAI